MAGAIRNPRSARDIIFLTRTRVSLASVPGTPEQYAELARVAGPMLEEWSRTKKAPRHADWLHSKPD